MLSKCTVQTPPPNASIEDTQSITPLDKRIYSESSDQEMDVWVKMTVPSTGTRPKTLSLIVTPFKKNCNSLDRRYKRCGSSAHCVRAELFCDGAVNFSYQVTKRIGSGTTSLHL